MLAGSKRSKDEVTSLVQRLTRLALG
jgi:hypothetical protein